MITFHNWCLKYQHFFQTLMNIVSFYFHPYSLINHFVRPTMLYLSAHPKLGSIQTGVQIHDNIP